jgi:hypothetical protein
MNETFLGFPLLSGGEAHGLNDAGIETFIGKESHNLARECAQNALDAAITDENDNPTKVILIFDEQDIQCNSIPCIEDIKDVLSKCKDYWDKDAKVTKFVDKALGKLSNSTVSILNISDFNTTGLTGEDKDKSNNWHGLVRSGGASNKALGAGGSYGIGKFAAFACSSIRTVFYSTRTDGGSKVAFQGVVRLMTHQNANQEETQGVGYIGLYDQNSQNYFAIRNEKQIPSAFLRMEQGTSIHIPVFDIHEDWATSLIKSILENFWYSIWNEQIEFIVKGTKINKDSVEYLISQYCTEEDYAWMFFQTIKSDLVFETELKIIGSCKLYLLYGDKLPKKVALTRKPGMIVDYLWFRKNKGFAGLFICDNPEGNEFLRKMEPPRHDSWDPERYDENRPLARGVKRNIRHWINECIKASIPRIDAEQVDLEEVAKYFPSSEENYNEEFPQGTNPTQERDAFTSSPLEEVKIYTNVYSSPATSGDSSSGGTHGDGGSNWGGSRKGNGDSSGNNSFPNEDEGGGSEGTQRKFTIPARYVETDDNCYLLTLRTENDFRGDIEIIGVGDESNEAINIEKAEYISDNKAINVEQGKVKGIEIKSNVPKKIKLKLNSTERLAIRVDGYENSN